MSEPCERCNGTGRVVYPLDDGRKSDPNRMETHWYGPCPDCKEKEVNDEDSRGT